MKIIPAVDLINGKTVRLEQGQYDRKLSYDIDPAEAAKKWEDAGAELIHVVDLDGAKEGKPINLSVIERIIKTVKVPVEAGGGYRNKFDIEDAINIGVSRVIIGSKAFQDLEFARDCIQAFGQKVILSCDARSFKPCIQGWETGLDISFFDILEKFVSFGAKKIIYTDINKDGTLEGPSVRNIEKILDKVNVKVISAGGIKTVEDVIKLKRLEEKGLIGVIVGRALYDGTIDLKEAIDACKADNSMS